VLLVGRVWVCLDGALTASAKVTRGWGVAVGAGGAVGAVMAAGGAGAAGAGGLATGMGVGVGTGLGLGSGMGVGVGTGLGLGSAVGAGAGCSWRFSRTWESVLSVATSLSASGDRGESGLGLANAVRRSLAAAMTMSVLEAMGIVTWWGNHVTVSMMRVPLVSVIQIL
jgi:hypothetical protein